MKRKRQSTSLRDRCRQHWGWWVAFAVLIIAALVAFQIWRVTAPPPTVVNTRGFDPVIAAAITDTRKAVLRSPRSADARGRMGMVLLAHQLRAESSLFFAQASAFAPRDPRWPYLLGVAQLVDNPMAAVTNLEHAAGLFSDRESAPRLKFADTLLSLGRVDEAEAQYRQVAQREPNSAAAALGLAKVANARERFSDAANFLSAAMQDPTTRRAAHRLLINVNQRLGRASEAEQLARTLADLPNDNPVPDSTLEAVEQFKTGEQVWLDQADEWIKTGRAAEAARLLEKAVATYPKSDRAMFFLGRARARLGDVAGAEKILTRAVEVAPSSVEAQMQLGALRLNQGRARAAQPCFRAALQAKPNLPEAWFNLGLSLGTDVINRAECIAAFREAIRLKPNLIEAYLGLAVALRADGQNQAAADELQRALELQPPEPLRRRLAGTIETRAKIVRTFCRPVVVTRGSSPRTDGQDAPPTLCSQSSAAE
jgi:tetratricopeptide (TPR) repeat protein